MFHSFRQKFLINFWHTGKAMIALAIVATAYYGIMRSGWAVTGEMTRWGGEFLELFGMDLSGYSYYKKQNLSGTPFSRSAGLMLIGMFIGALVAALWANKVKIRFPASKIRVFQAIVGGILTGFGARLAFGCNLANFFTGLPYFSLHTWFFTIFMVGGIYTAVKLLNIDFFKPKAKLVRSITGKGVGLEIDKTKAKRHFMFGSIIFALFLVWFFVLLIKSPAIDVANKKSLLSVALLFGFIFGFIISRGQICFTSCFRDMFLFGRTIAIKGAIIGMVISCVLVYAFVLNGHGIKLVEISSGVMIGGFLFGFGIVFAGGCECGWTYRAFEGQIHFMIVGVSNFVGTAILALSYDAIPNFIKSGVKVNMLESFGNFGGFVINLALFGVMAILAYVYQKNFFKKRGF
ncbi:selenium metabolism membrane protein YedE/FdhT [Campylobacter sp. RM12327]|uniref:selenium metabolism membrane protein YedE/FdhT n=1 Tax=Campylobacter sputorum TaxID=206 RepID=UPI000B772281|nr:MULTISPECIES: selenium metabolism membrane protein YedE/FdhT [Campylobacter]ASM40222.1 formate dehydrogenase biogenesis protein FdhT [Campylobacter sputorum]MBE7358508.1 selenium metabolism membrane protein YedE/FdhT [Campylobacter sp. RM11302]MBF6669751.1 selenium metabolism membrane protein YedE/FdhT [Campylobacter sp. RM12327]MBF6674961.1 selenium metabolism membrane protein YedE/FdhT [Campylobacter sp. RM13538]MBF6676339.1 selenium metabolism membrane protein YedE/FdhT [Campylobacter sp